MSDQTHSEAGRPSIEQLADEFAERVNRGERPSAEEYIQRYPDLSSKIRRLFPLIHMMEDHSLGHSSDVPASAEQVPERIGDFRIIREVGRGGMGIVFEAKQESLARRVALKVLPEYSRLDPRYQQRFQQEAKAAAALHHTNIVPVFGIGEDNGLSYMAMQFIDGNGLHQVIDSLSKLSKAKETERCDETARPAAWETSSMDLARCLANERLSFDHVAGDHPGFRRADHEAKSESATKQRVESEVAAASSEERVHLDGLSSSLGGGKFTPEYWQNVARIGCQVADALAHAHSRGVLHRDIKPSNLLLDHQGSVWISDFGLAKIFEGGDLTRTGEILGTIRYMPPEQLEGKSDSRSDLYSLGLTLYEMLTLRPAFDETDRGKLLQQVTNDRPVAPRKINSRIPRDLETIVLKLTSREPAGRYADAELLAADFRRFLAGRPIQARRASWAERSIKWVRRRPVIAALIMALVSSVAIGQGLVTWKWREAQRAAEVARVEADTKREIFEFFVLDMLGAADPSVRAPDTKVVDLLDVAAENLEARFADRPQIKAIVENTLGQSYLAVGRYQDASKYLQSSLQTRELLNDTESVEAITTMMVLGDALDCEQRFDEAEEVLRKAIQTSSRVLGPKDRVTLGGMAKLGEALQTTRRHEEAQELLRNVIQWVEEEYSPLEPIRLTALNSLGASCSAEDKLDEAEAIFTEYLELRRRLNGPESPELMNALNQLASLHFQRREYAKAEPYFRQVMEMLPDVLPPDHPKQATYHGNFGACLGRLGKHDEAEQHVLFAYDLLRRTMGEDYESTEFYLKNVHGYYWHCGKPDEAEKYHRIYLITRLRTFQPSEEENRTPGYWIKILETKLNEHDRELDYDELFQSLQDYAVHNLPSDHPKRANYLANLGVVLTQYGRYAEADKYLTECFETRKDTLGIDAPDTQWTADQIVALYEASNEPDKAEAFQEQRFE